MKKYKYFLFDLDGTLTDPREGITRSVQYALDSFGIHVDNLDDLLCFIGPPLVDSFQEYYGFDAEKSVLARDKYRERYTVTGIFENAVIPGIPEMLEALKAAGGRIALATSKPEVMARRILDKYELTGYFHEIVGSGMNGEREKKAEVIEEVFARMGLGVGERQYALMVGDRLHDIRGAKACGIDSLGVYIGYAEPGELEREQAEYIAHSVEELRELLLSARQ